MPWCPKCKCEYVEGITECKKCGSNLVRELINPEQILAVGNKDKLLEVRDILQEKGFLSVEVVFEPADEVYVLISEQKDREEAKRLLLAINEKRKQELMKASRENEKGMVVLPYQKASEKAEEMKNSAYAFFYVGIPGLILDILCVFGIIPLHFSPTGQIMIFGTMGVLFLLLILIGVNSMKSFHKLEDSAKKEDKLSEEIKKWYQNEIKRSSIDEKLSEDMKSSDREEELYFARIEIIKRLLNEKFMNLDPAYLDEMVENIYQEYYDTEKNDHEN